MVKVKLKFKPQYAKRRLPTGGFRAVFDLALRNCSRVAIIESPKTVTFKLNKK